MRISVITTKAYDELERESLLFPSPSKGSLSRQKREFDTGATVAEIEALIKIVEKSITCVLDELIEMLKLCYEGE